MAQHNNITNDNSIPVNIFTGYMGAGKTTIIYNSIKTLKQQQPNIRIAWLKNEFGVNQIDTLLAAELNDNSNTEQNNKNNSNTAINAVVELLNGCICCTLIGQLSDALTQLLTDYKADRVVIESSGAASPMPLVHELQRLISNNTNIRIESVICVIDLLNYTKIEDISYSAKLQSKYTDMIVLNKYELLLQQCDNNVDLTERQIDTIIDNINELNDKTVKLRTVNGSIVPSILYDTASTVIDLTQNDHIEHKHEHSDQCNCTHNNHHSQEVIVLNWTNTGQLLMKQQFTEFLDSCDSDTYYRIKGVMLLKNENGTVDAQLINYAFGHYTLTVLTQPCDKFAVTFILRRDCSVKFVIKTIKRDLELNDTANTIEQVV